MGLGPGLDESFFTRGVSNGGGFETGSGLTDATTGTGSVVMGTGIGGGGGGAGGLSSAFLGAVCNKAFRSVLSPFTLGGAGAGAG